MRQETIKALREIVGQEYCQVDKAIRRQHGYSEKAIPDVVVYPENSEQVARVVKAAIEEGCPVVPWGAGTMAWRGLLPLTGGVAINLTRMKKIIEYDYENQTAYVEAGISLKELQEVLVEHKLYWPVEPLEPDSCTLGGCIATNASGPSKLGYGDAKFHLLGLELVTPTGDIIDTGGKTVKNVQDYDNTRFLAGSWGSLGIVTKAMLKLRPLPEKEGTVLIVLKDLEAAAKAATTIRNETLPVALELLDAAAMGILARAGYKPNSSGVGVLARFTGFVEQVDVMIDYIKNKYQAAVTLDEEAAVAVWRARGQLFPTLAGERGAILINAAVPFTKMLEFLTKARTELDKSNIEAIMAAHFGNAQVHIMLAQAPEAYAEVEKMVNSLADLAGSLNGMLVVDNITDMTLARRWVESRGKAIFEIMRRLKTSIDPHQIMAPNSKVLAYVTRPVS
ncbi:MAG: FAD-binding oxidoreductase [Clostridia bacterium]|nr:FAD-binding oxidoreductase [Clostridia bacterium]